MGAIRVRGRALPDGEYVDLYADGGTWTTDPVRDADLVGEGWLLPGLVDVHTHPGASVPGAPLSEELLRADLLDNLAAGITLLRAPGLAGDPPDWFGRDPDLPRAVHAGRWLAQPQQFIPGWGTHRAAVELPALAAVQAATTGWAKIIGDWRVDDPAVPQDVLAAAVSAVGDVGGRLAVHAQTRAGSRAAAMAGVHSLEHGQGLDLDLLPVLAAAGTALVPTLGVIGASLVRRLAEGRPAGEFVATARAHPGLVRSAVEAGVLVLAGTDSRPHGRVADEVRAIAATGVSPHRAVGSASWDARRWLGLPGLIAGAPADAVVYPTDPRVDLDCLDHPLAVILRGRCIRAGSH